MTKTIVYRTGNGLEIRGEVVFRAASKGLSEMVLVGDVNLIEEFKKRFGVPRNKQLGEMKITFERTE